MIIIRSTIAIVLLSGSTLAIANSSVSELAELSLEDLMGINIDESGDSGEKPSRWHLSLGAYHQKLEGYRSGSSELSNEEVLFRPGETRTNNNYPVLPTTIEQSIYTASLAYRLSSIHTLSLNVPYVRQGTDHISIVPNYPEFLIETSGLGDIGLALQHRFKNHESVYCALNLGLSLPTGSIDEQGDTPRAPGDQQLPYTMQLGSGTYDAKLGFAYSRGLAAWNIALDANYVHRIGRNDRDYRLGNRFTLSTSAERSLGAGFSTGFSLSYQHAGSISGRDEEITVPGPFPYPAGITNPANFGGDVVRADATLKYRISERFRVSLSYSEPLSQNLNGIQPQAKGRWNFSWSMDFKRSSSDN
ncbi:MAG: transporter [Pseudomonadales bacterium]